MIYKPFKELELSTLGLGNMRLPTIGESGQVNEKKAREIVERHLKKGEVISEWVVK